MWVDYSAEKYKNEQLITVPTDDLQQNLLLENYPSESHSKSNIYPLVK